MLSHDALGLRPIQARTERRRRSPSFEEESEGQLSKPMLTGVRGIYHSCGLRVGARGLESPQRSHPGKQCLLVRGPRKWIRRGWIWRFWGAPIFRPEVPKPFQISILGPLDWKSGRPKNAKSNHDGSNPHSRPSDLGATKRTIFFPAWDRRGRQTLPRRASPGPSKAPEKRGVAFRGVLKALRTLGCHVQKGVRNLRGCHFRKM